MTLKTVVKDVDPWQLLAAVSGSARTILLAGPRGIGKTYWAIKALGVSQDPLVVTLTPETIAAELRGHFVPRGMEFIWHHAPAIRAWKEGRGLVLNEIHRVSGDVETFLHGLLDSEATAEMTLPNNETVKPAQGFRCVATMNGEPGSLLEDALLDRFDAIIRFTKPALVPVEGPVGELIDIGISLRRMLAIKTMLNNGVALGHALLATNVATSTMEAVALEEILSRTSRPERQSGLATFAAKGVVK